MKVTYAYSEEERNRIYNLMYKIYVKEMREYGDIANHGRNMLYDEYDRSAHYIYASIDDVIVGAMRMIWGADGHFSEEFNVCYDLPRFQSVVSPAQIIVFMRFMVLPAYRSTEITFQLMIKAAEFALENNVQLCFCDCQPHLLNLYTRVGFRTYTKTFNDPSAGLLVPLVAVVEDVEYLKRIESPICYLFKDRIFESDVPNLVAPLLPEADNSQGISSDEAMGKWIRNFQLQFQESSPKISIFDGMTEEEMRQLIEHSHVIDCKRNDLIIRKEGMDRTLILILSGTVEVRLEGHLLNVETECGIIGEMAFLLKSRRTADVYAASDKVSILSLRETILKNLHSTNPALASKFYRNLAKILCAKLLSSNERYAM